MIRLIRVKTASSYFCLKNVRIRTIGIRHFSLSPIAMKIYTKTGDAGTSALFNGERRPKDEAVFESLGTNDELSSALGLAMEYCESDSLSTISTQLHKIQCCIQDANSNIATPRASSSESKIQKTAFDPEGSLTKELETWIDEMDGHLPPLRSFILPSGGLASCSLHVARSICRRAERRVFPLVTMGECDKSVGVFFNRLSDYLFTSARFACHKSGHAEKIYKKPI